MRIKAILLAAVACGLFAGHAAAQAIPRIKARILSFDGKVLTVSSGTAGQSLSIGLIPSTHLMYEEKQDPAAIKPGVLMPKVPMTPAQRAQVVAYLQSLI